MAQLPATQDEVRLVGTLARLRKCLEGAIDDVQRLEIRDDAALVVLVAKEKGFIDIAVAASEMVARSERAVVKAHPPHRGGRGKRCEPCSHLSREALRQMRAVHSKLTDEEFEARVAEHHEAQVPITRRSLLLGPTAPTQILQSGRMEWFTASHIIEAARHSLGGIDLDPASCAEANKTVKATRFFDKDDDGLTMQWAGRVWMNPPFRRDLGRLFIEKLVTEPGVSSWVCLTANTTESRWGQVLLNAADVVCFPNERLSFYGPDAHPAKNGKPLQGQMIAARFNRNRSAGITRFVDAFSDIGWVCRGVHGRAA